MNKFNTTIVILICFILVVPVQDINAQCPPTTAGPGNSTVSNTVTVATSVGSNSFNTFNDSETDFGTSGWTAPAVNGTCGDSDPAGTNPVVLVADCNSDVSQTICYEFPVSSFDPAETGATADFIGFDFSYLNTTVNAADGSEVDLVGILDSEAYQTVGGVCTQLVPAQLNPYGHPEFDDPTGTPGTDAGAFDPNSSIWFCVEVGFTMGSTAGCGDPTENGGAGSGVTTFTCGNAVTYGNGDTNVAAATCGSSFTYCYDDGLTDNVIWEVCPTSPTEGVALTIDAGSFETSFDILEIYTGASGSGTGGTQLFGDWGDLTGETVQSFEGECLTLVISSDGTSGSCVGGSETALAVSTTCLTPCDETCAAVTTEGCNVWVTPDDTFAGSYDEIEANGGVSCFPSLNVSTTTQSHTSCYEYVATTPSFVVLPGTSTIEYQDTDGNECDQNITNITVYSDGTGCTTPVDITATNEFTGATIGNTYVVCVTGEAGNGAAEGVCAFECIATSITPLAPVCDQFNAELLYARDCNTVVFAIGFDTDAAGVPTNGATSDPADYTWTMNSSIAGTQTDNIGFFDTDADGDGDFLGNIMTFTADQLEQGCNPVPWTTSVTVLCPDGTTTATLDAGLGVQTLSSFDVIADFGETTVLYPDVANFTLVETPGGCGTAPMVTITAPNGDVCYTETGTAPTEPACGSGATNSSPLSYDQTFGDSSADALISGDCSRQFMNTIAADCVALPCACDAEAGTICPEAP